MWKDFFYFSRKQRSGIAILIVLILMILSIEIILMNIFPEPTPSDLAFQQGIGDFQGTLTKDSINANNGKEYILFTFNPNTVDSATLTQLGLSPWAASNVMKYRAKGGKFRKPDDFKKIYGLSPEKFEELKPYITITDQ